QETSTKTGDRVLLLPAGAKDLRREDLRALAGRLGRIMDLAVASRADGRATVTQDRPRAMTAGQREKRTAPGGHDDGERRSPPRRGPVVGERRGKRPATKPQKRIAPRVETETGEVARRANATKRKRRPQSFARCGPGNGEGETPERAGAVRHRM